MKKSYNQISDVRNESVEGARRLFRAISDVVRHLDERRGRAKTCRDLFAPSLEAQRLKLRDSCEKLMFLDPVGYGQKGEELLWRKGYYEVVTTAKRLRKNNAWNPVEVAYMQNHLSAGVGHYHHLVFRLQIEFKLDLRGVIDFPLLVNDDGLLKGKTSSRRSTDPACVEWAREALHRCLVYLGDLSRYFLDLHPRWDTGLPLRYYLQALNMNSEIGMPHNQLGTLSGNQNYSVDAAYHYMRCLTCPEPFEGAEGNLQRIFNKNSKWLEVNCTNDSVEDKIENMTPTEKIHSFVSRFLLLIDVWFFDKTSVGNIHQLCHQTLLDLHICLGFAKPFPADDTSKNEQLDLEDLSLLQSAEENNEKPEYLKDDMVFKMVVMLLLCVSRLQGRSSQQLSAVVAFTLAVFSQLVQQVILHIQDSVFNMSLNSPPPTKAASPVLNNCSSTVCIISSPDTACEKKSECAKLEKEEEQMNGHVENGDNARTKKSEKKATSLLKKLRRRRRRRRRNSSNVISSEDSDYSEGDFPYGASSSSSDGNSDISETEEPCIIRSDDDEDEDDVESDDSETSSSLQIDPKKQESQDNITLCNGETSNHADGVEKKDCIPNGNGKDQPVVNGTLDASASVSSLQETSSSEKPLDPADVIELVADEGLLDVIKVCADWLRGDSNIIKACGRSSQTLLTRVINLLNLINVDAHVLMKQNDGAKFYKLKNIQDIFQKVPMPEDIELKGLPFLKISHDFIDWEFLRHHCLHSKEEALLRVCKLVDFGRFLATIEETGVTYNEVSRLFSVAPNTKENEGTSSEVKSDENPAEFNSKLVIVGGVPVRADPLQKHMGELWLRAEVSSLESRRSRRPRFSPYLAVDAEALTYHLHLVKQLVGARKFIILIPHVVMTFFDSKKNEVGRVRESIRWLDAQFRHGNRFLRAQRPHERLPLPLIKYPKKKEEAAWLFFNIVECCYYFSQSSNNLRDMQLNVPVVTLLTGQRATKDDASKSFSPLGVAKSAGINLEHIEVFHAKWKTSSKSHG
ncbi:nonsense-mediated mRNA decay factor SMG5 [Anabrus simplex]|uniref:nonsense-mediated mRNA decay factor SMG5 n=1 Tax=Anabrus simplex TaxID=316456 RepID=UPI0035A3ABEE